jgi:hypothetical protein
MISRQSSTARGVVELYDQRRRRQHRDYLVTLVAVTLMLGFLFGLFVGAVIVARQIDDSPKEEMFHEQGYRYQPA